MRRKHHRRYRGRFTRLASLSRSLTSPAAAGLLLALAALLVVTPAEGNAQSATYRVTFEGKFTASALASGVSVPSGEHFTTLIGAVHNGGVTFWSSGALASAGVEGVAELGNTGTFKSEINADTNAVAVIEKSLPSGGTPTATVDLTVTTDHPLVTLLSMIAPSPDWFVGVSGLSLLDAQGDWLASHTVELFPYDAGTEEGTEFSLSNAATSPQGAIASIKGTGKFSNEPIATLTFTRQSVTPEITSAATFTVDEGTTAVETLTAEDQDSAAADLEWSKAGGADADDFTLSTDGDLAFAAAPDYENPGDADADRTYEVTVQVSDGTHTDTEDVVVTVKNVDEAGAVSLFPAQLRVRAVVRPTLSDPDGGISAVAWQWAESSDKTTWTNIDGATQADYLPTEARRGKYLRATATRYRDGEGSNKTSRTESNAVVGARAPGPELSVKTLVSGLRYPWGIAFTPDGTMLFTERDGHPQQDPLPDPPEGLSSLRPDGTLQTVSADFSDLDTDENGGVMGLEVDPDFVDNRRIYICQQHTGSVIQVVAWTIDATYTTASRANDPLVGNIPRVDNHNGCRLRFGPDGNLWISTGDTEAIGTVPQDLNSLGGKILRVDPLTGAAPADNPFPGSLVYSYGHRNPQGLALRPGTRQMWAVEHGPTVDDEINLLVPGANYGWDPVPTDENGDPTSGYDDTAPMTDLVKFPGAVEARWSSGNPTLATSGGIFLDGEQWGLWEGRLAVATLKGRSLRIFEFTEDGTFVSHVVPEELDHFGDRDHRLRTPMIGPDHALYLSTSTRGWRDEILRVTPQQPPEFPNDADTRQVTENTGGDMVVATVEATDYNHDELTYTLDGTDGESFYILDENIGELRVRSTTQLDFETRREYEVTVTATDAQDTSDTVTLTIEVTDIEHEGTVSLPLTQPRVGSPVQASLSDPDGGVTGTTWQWERSDDGVTGWEDIDGARSASYTPGTDDIGKYLRATVTYTNIHGPGKTAQSVTSDAVGAVPNTNPEFPSAPVVRRVAENTAEGQPIGSPVEADDADGDSLRYTLSGRDGNLFGINTSSGQLLTRAAHDYEMANEYEVDVSVSDGKDTNAVSDNKVDDSVRVTIEVTNVDEPGSVSLLPAQLRVWTVVRATLSDPDGVDLHAVSWQWAASSDGVSWTNVPAPEGTQADYAPTDIVQGEYLRATASYTDGQGTGKRAEVVSDNVVGERESGPELTVVPLVSGLSVPWGVAFAPDGTMLFTERGDRLSSRLTDGTVQSVSADFDDLLVSGEAGLMAIVVDPAFVSNRRFYTCQAHTGRVVQVIAWTFNDDTYTAATRAEDPLVGNIPAASRHSGCRLRFGPQGYLWIATGDASAGTVPQDRNSLGGKVLRVDAATGAAVAGNPSGSRIYTYGHRNVQGLARRPGTNQMWSVEHGPTVDDEINLLSAGGNYGWDPVPSYNEGVPMTDLVKFPGAVEASWSSGNHTLATSGGIFLEGEDWGEWDGRLAVAALKAQLLHVFEFTADGAFVSQVAVPAVDGIYGRLRTPMLGPDGALYVTTSNGRGQDKILRVSASRAPAFLTDTETRNVDENNDISTFVAKVLALDSDGDTLTYTLSGPDAEAFSIPDAAVGAMWANVAFDYETKRSYEVTVTATDPQSLNDSTILTITVMDTDEPPPAPSAPTVSAKAGTTDSLDVAWAPPPNAGKPGIESYDLQYRKGASGAWTNGPQDQTTTGATTTGLEAGSSYQVQVRATNDEGDSPWSTAGTAQTNTLQEAAPEITSAATFTVDEGTTAVETLTAEDQDSAAADLEWSKAGGADADDFTLSTDGDLAFAAAPDYENPGDADADRTYEVTVQVSDGDNPVTADIRVTLQNVVELFTELEGPSSTDYAENRAVRVATFIASSEADRDGIAWHLSGDDDDHFSIDNPAGILRFHIDPDAGNSFPKLPDYEMPDDKDANNAYAVTVLAQAGSAFTSPLRVTVTVTDENEAGAISLSTVRPKAGSVLTADLTDPDGVTAGTVTWQWERSAGRNTWVVIPEATAAGYSPTAADTNAFLRVTATYGDEHGSGHSVRKVASNVVTGPLLTALQVATDAATANPTRAMNPAFGEETLHYAIGCNGGDTMQVTLRAPPGARVAVDGWIPSRNSTGEMTATIEVTPTSDVPISVTDSNGAHTLYHVHCLDAKFYQIEAGRYPGAEGVFEGLLLFRHEGHMVMMDSNGVPRFRETHAAARSRTWFFRVGPDEVYRYAYATSISNRVDVLDQHLEVIAEQVSTVAPLRGMDPHAFAILPNGNYLLMSYELEVRDLSHLTFTDENGRPYVKHPLTDSAIQIITPDDDDREALFTWNSWGKMLLGDCVQHRFAKKTETGYAHLNSLQMVGDHTIVGSFRGCSKVLGIDATTGAVAWRVGRTNLSDEEWASREIGPAPLIPVNDPEGEFCGQHSATLLPNGHLLLFDNGAVCLINPWKDHQPVGTHGEYSRAVEYALDHNAGEAVFVRDHSLHGNKEAFGYSSGQVVPMDNGDWLISWGRNLRGQPPLEETVTQVDPATGQEKFFIRFTEKNTEERPSLMASPVPADALADTPGPLTAEILQIPASSLFHLGPTDAPKVVVAFSRPVVDFAADTTSVSLSGATIAGIGPHVAPGDPANAYLFTLTPTGVGPITFAPVAGQSCASGGICTADGTVLTEVPASHVIPPRPTGPTVESITSGATHPTKDGFTVTIAFSEPVTGLAADEIEVTNGTGSNFAGSGESYTLDVAPEAGIEDEVTVKVTAGAVVDGVNNGNLQASEAFSVDTRAPTVSTIAITSNPGTDRTYAADDEIRVRVTFSETVEVTGRPRLQIELGGGSRTATYGGGAGTAALVFAYEVAGGESDTEGVGVEADSLSGGTITDEARNNAVLDHDGLAADAGHKVDGVRPELAASGGAVVNGTTLTLTWDEPLDGSSIPASGDFTVAGGDRVRTVTRVRVSGSTVTLTLDAGAEHEEAGIRVSYTPGTNPIRDVPGNQAEALSRQSVRNETPDTTPPEVSSLAIGSNPGSDRTYAAGDEIQVTVTFSETVEVEGTPRLRLRVGIRNRTAGYLRGTGTAALVFGYEVADGDEDSDGVSVNAGRIALNGGTIQDEVENPAELDHEAVAAQAGHKVDGVRPAFVSAAVDGSSLTLTYGKALDGGSRPASGSFTVEVAGSGRSVSGVSISGSVVTLTLNPAVEHGDARIRVRYTVPTGVGANPIRDAVGNQARELSSRSVTNTTGAPNTAPEITSPSSFDVPENRMVARRLAARDSDPGDEVTGWAIVGGADQGQFSIASDTGDLSFREPSDYEAPGDNQHLVTVEVRSGAGAREFAAEQTFTIRVTDEREPPEVPDAPTFSGETADSLRVSWSEPDNTGPTISDYDVQYRKEGAGGFTGAPHQGPGRTLTLADLEPGTVYEVQVRATNDEGTGDWSESGEGMTVTPLTVQMTTGLPPPVEGAFSLRLSFSETVTGFTLADIETRQAPDCRDENNVEVPCDPPLTIVDPTIAALQTTDDRIYTTTLSPRTTEVNHNYTLTLTVPAGRAISAAGNKPNEAATLDVRIAPPGVTAPISSLRQTASPGNGQVTLRWNAPANTGGAPIVRYEYRWRESGAAEFGDWVRVAPAARTATVRELTNGREYVFEARGVNALGYGPVETARATPSPPPFVPPPPPPPTPQPPGTPSPGGGGGGGGGRARPPSYPGIIRAEGGDGEVTLTWDAPASRGSSRIQHYEYRIDGEGEWISTGSTGRTHAITGLIAGRIYFFHLRAVSAAGPGAHRISPEATPVADLDFTHFANGGFITSTLALVNAGAYPVRPAIYFYDQDGDPIAARRVVELTPDLEVGGDGALRPRTVMNPLDELTIATHGRGGLRAGSVTVRAPGSIGGVLRFDIPGHGVAGVADSPTLRDALVPVRRQEMGINTGVAVRNRGTATLKVQCRLMRAGAVLEEADIRLKVNGQDSRFIDQVFPAAETSDFAGSVRCTAPEPGLFSAVAFELDGVHRIFTTLPVVPVPAILEQEQEDEQEQEEEPERDATRLDFTHFANGGKIVSSLVLLNAGAYPVRPAIYFHDRDGGPIAAESMVDITGDMEVGDDGALRPGTAIDPLGELTISTHGRGTLKVGSVAVTAEGPIGGVLRFDIPGLGVAGVGDSPPLRDALVPVRRQDGSVNTGVAVHNRGAAALLVRCRLMRAGAVLEETMIPLAANGQDSRFIDQVFPTADTSDFAGSVRCMTPEPGRFSAVAFELDGVHRIFTTLPVVPVVDVP